MNFITTLFSQLGQVFNAQTAGRKLLLLAVVMGSMVGMVMLTLYAQSGGGYQIVYANLTTKEAGEGLSKLSAKNIKGRIENGGTAIAVPASRKDEALILLMEEGISSSGVVGYEAMDKSTLGQSRRMEDRNYHRVREGELTRTLMSIQEIERARVHLALPDNSMFVGNEQKATASVALKLRSNAKLTERQVSGIVHLIASSVENLSPESVTVVDQGGNLLNSPRDEGSTMQFTDAQGEFKGKYEDEMKKRIESMIEKIVGPGKVVARVQTDFDFSTTREIKETYNPDEQDPIKRSETISQEGRSAASVKEGAAGSSSNLPDADAAKAVGTTETTDNHMTQTSEYAVSRTYAETASTVPTPTRVSVGILVDGMYEKGTDAGGKETNVYRPRTPEELEVIENMAKMAIGFDDKRLDQINVACSPFQIQELDEKPGFFASYNFQRYLDLGIRWGVVAVLGLLLILLVLKPAVHGIMVSQAHGPQHALPAGSHAAAEAAALPEALRSAMLASELAGDSHTEGGKAAGGRSSLAKDLLAQSNKLLDQVQGAGKEAQFLSKALQDEVLANAKENPEKTVSLMRHWMEET